MTLKALLIALVLAGTYSQILNVLPLPIICGPNQIYTSKGCFNNCSSSQYQTCPNVFDKLYNPRFCGVSSDQQFSSYTYECQACKAPGIVAVKSGVCECATIFGYPTIAGCFDSCSNPTYKKCSTPYPAPSTPSNCVLLKNGTFINATDRCQGCLRTDGVAVGKGACSCIFVICPFGSSCSYGNCIKDTLIVPACSLARPCASGY
jgi:hypothetical protein